MEREKKTQTLAMKVQSSLFERLSAIAENEDRPIGYVARELMLRGLGLYESDSQLRDSRPLTRGSAQIVARIEPAPVPSTIEDDREAIRRQIGVDIDEPGRQRKAG